MIAASERATPPVVWVLVHDLSRTGVPVVLDRMLSALPAARSSVHVVAFHGGPLESSLRGSVASLTILESLERRSLADAVSVGLMSLGAAPAGVELRRRVWRRRCADLPRADVAVVHGAGAWPLTSIVSDDVPLVLHLHELATGLDRCIPPAAQRTAFDRACRVLAVSAPVADLALERGAPCDAIDLVPGVIEVMDDRNDGPDSNPDRRSQVPQAVDAVMGAGVPGWRKGTDRLAAVAHELGRLGHAGGVGWVGGRPHGVDAPWVDAPDPISWFPPMADPWSILRAARVIVVPSREDPLPLVALEAGLHRKAVVAMATGGLPDLLAEGRGVVDADQDVGRFVAEVAALLDDPTRAADLGAALHAYVLAHHDSAVVAPTWWDIVRRTAMG